MNALQWTPYLDECCRALEKYGEYQSDVYLVYLVRQQHIIEKIERTFSLERQERLDSSGNLRRLFFTFASNAVSQRRRSAQALLTLASPSTQVAQSHSCSPFQWLTNHDLLIIQSCRAKVVNSTRLRLYSRRPSWLLRSSNRNPPSTALVLVLSSSPSYFLLLDYLTTFMPSVSRIQQWRRSWLELPISLLAFIL